MGTLRPMRHSEITGDAMTLVGVAAITVALWLVAAPLGLAFAGIALVVLGAGITPADDKPKPGKPPKNAQGPFAADTATIPRTRSLAFLRRPPRPGGNPE